MNDFMLLDQLALVVWVFCFVVLVFASICNGISRQWHKHNMNKRTKLQVVKVATNITYMNEKAYKKLYYNSPAFYEVVKTFSTTIPNKVTRTLNKIFIYFQK